MTPAERNKALAAIRRAAKIVAKQPPWMRGWLVNSGNPKVLVPRPPIVFVPTTEDVKDE